MILPFIAEISSRHIIIYHQDVIYSNDAEVIFNLDIDTRPNGIDGITCEIVDIKLLLFDENDNPIPFDFRKCNLNVTFTKGQYYLAQMEIDLNNNDIEIYA